MAQTSINVRMDESLKEDFSGLCEDFGLTMTAAFNVFAKAVVRQRKIPFEVSALTPNAETIAAIEEVEEMIAGKRPKKAVSVDDFLKEMYANDEPVNNFL